VRDGAAVLGWLLPVMIDIIWTIPIATGASHFIRSLTRACRQAPISMRPPRGNGVLNLMSGRRSAR
jgi:hypothetical protein